MSLRSLWPAFPPSRILYEDDDLVAVDKPPFASTHAPDAERRDDMVTRLTRMYEERDGVPAERVYLGIHQRLDRDTSGVLVFARRREANAGLALAFEGRLAKKTYVAGVVGWPVTAREGTLRHRLAPGDGGRMRVVTGRLGQEAVTRFRVLRRVGERALLELRPETGRTHQIRVQIAASGARLGGDRLYDGAPAPRLLLHAAALELPHPGTRRPMRLAAPVPPELTTWLEGGGASALGDDGALDRALAAAADARWQLGTSTDTDAFRLAHDEADAIPGAAIDRYGDWLLVHLWTPEAESARERLLDAAMRLGPRGVYVVSHPKNASRVADPRALELSPPRAVRGESAPERFEVSEAGVRYWVRLGDGLKTGLFLDQRANRRRVASLAPGARVLNLFAYTCAFSVVAAKAGAASTMSVDATPAVLDWGRDNLALAGLGGDARHAFVAADAIGWLEHAARRAERFDLVVLDPPSFATTKSSRFSASSDYRALAAQALRVVAPGGRLLACTNHRGVVRAKLRRWLHEAARDAQREAKQVKDLPDPIDFPMPFGAECHLKSVLVTLV